MRSLDNPQLMREIIMDHYQHPRNRGLIDDDSYDKINMNSETCIDDLDIQIKFDGERIVDMRFDGEACAISTSTTSIMTELVIGKTKEEALAIVENYMNMIYERDYDASMLEEAIAFQNTHKQANRIKCATLSWDGLLKLIKESEE